MALSDILASRTRYCSRSASQVQATTSTPGSSCVVNQGKHDCCTRRRTEKARRIFWSRRTMCGNVELGWRVRVYRCFRYCPGEGGTSCWRSWIVGSSSRIKKESRSHQAGSSNFYRHSTRRSFRGSPAHIGSAPHLCSGLHRQEAHDTNEDFLPRTPNN